MTMMYSVIRLRRRCRLLLSWGWFVRDVDGGRKLGGDEPSSKVDMIIESPEIWVPGAAFAGNHMTKAKVS